MSRYGNIEYWMMVRGNVICVGVCHSTVMVLFLLHGAQHRARNITLRFVCISFAFWPPLGPHHVVCRPVATWS